jgi:hypothetical protein
MFESNDRSGGRSLFRDEPSLLTNPITWAVAAIVLGGVGVAYWYKQRGGEPPPPPPIAQPAKPPAPPAAEPAIRNPIPELPPEEGRDDTPLPALNESDVPVQEGLTRAVGKPAIDQFLVPDNLVRHVVVTVDNLPRKKVPVERRPVKATPGQVTTVGVGDVVTLSEESYARYAPFIKLVQTTDTAQLVEFYFRYYPLFQQAYEDLGYPNAYFNDRVIDVIDHLLATPDVRGPIQLVQPKVFYEFADPKLEGRSAGQKLLIRMGPQNAAALKKKLREIRAQIEGRA